MAVSMYRGRQHVRAVAVVVEDSDTGERTLIGSRDVSSVSFSVDTGQDWYADRLTRLSYTLEAEMSSVVIQRVTPYDGPLALPQRGLYLPGIGFKALPEPEP